MGHVPWSTPAVAKSAKAQHVAKHTLPRTTSDESLGRRVRIQASSRNRRRVCKDDYTISLRD